MAEWIINRPIAGYSEQKVEADDIEVGKEVIKLYNHGGDVVCAVGVMPGLIVKRADATGPRR